MKGSAKNKKRGAIGALILLVAIMAALAVLGFAKGVFARLPQVDRGSAWKNTEQGRYNFLIMGQDRAAGLSDVMMIASFDVVGREISVLQIPRDTYFNYTDRDYKKINGAPAACGGAAEFASLLSRELGVPIDFYISLDLDAFARIVDAMGGVRVRVPCDMEYSDPYQSLTVKLHAGEQLLDGETASQLVRFRSGYIRGDVSRIDVQKIFLASAARRAAEIRDPVSLYKVFVEASEGVQTNLSGREAAFFAYHFTQVGEDNIRFATAPGEEIQSEQSGAWYYVLSRDAMNEIEKILFDSENFDKSSKFVDNRVKSFYDIYNKYCSYKIYSSKDILNESFEIK